MKPVQLLPLCAASAAAGDAITNQMNMGICRSPSLSSFPLFPDLAVCSHDGLISRYDGVKPTEWTHSAPCFRNGTTSEFCIYTSQTFADSRGMSLLTSPRRAANIRKARAFTNPEEIRGVNQDIVRDRDASYTVVAMPGKGMGVVAAKPLNRGDLIMSNTVSIMIDYAAFETVPEDEMRRLQVAGVEYLPMSHRSRLMNLSSHSEVEGYYKRVEKILSTNAFDIDIGDDDEYSFYVVFPEISRMNHDCRPNADYHFDTETLTQHIHAVRNIAQGEEITISYIDPIKSRKKRLDKLEKTWGFKCSCSLCTQSRNMGKQSDSRLGQIKELRKEFHDYTTESRATPQMAELFISLYEQEHLDGMLYEAFTYAAIEWNGVGEPWLATKYARLAVDYGLASVGPNDHDVVEMQNLVLDPWTHWSWMLRTSKRMRWGREEKKKEEESDGIGGF